jgi:hypothetical protein
MAEGAEFSRLSKNQFYLQADQKHPDARLANHEE